ncbi:MAG: 50S ribosomal protein L13 [Actinobacteria bacterium]|nr:50S ribosomal protein L13 [Actinomycetota bacterium]
MKTFVAKPSTIERKWYIVDAKEQRLGRLATRVADTLRGKNKPDYTPNIDTGDFVIVINADRIAVTGRKMENKIYYRHTGYPGGLKQRTLAEMMARKPEDVIRLAVKGMMPKNRLARAQMKKLKIFTGPEHAHAAQKPEELKFG